MRLTSLLKLAIEKTLFSKISSIPPHLSLRQSSVCVFSLPHCTAPLCVSQSTEDATHLARQAWRGRAQKHLQPHKCNFLQIAKYATAPSAMFGEIFFLQRN